MARSITAFVLAMALVFAGGATIAGSSVPTTDAGSRTGGGLTAYIGVIPAEIVKGHPSSHPEQTMHGGVPQGRHEYHLIAAIFDAVSEARISDAIVTAKISGVGLAGSEQELEPMKIENTITYGAFIDLPGADLYTIRLVIERPGSGQVVTLDFKYDHR